MDSFLGRALMDPATGLPNMPYFCLIQNWEERKARRRSSAVCIVRLQIVSGSEEARRALTFGLCQELRSSDLIASEGRNEYRILLTSPDAEHVEALAERIRLYAETLASVSHQDGKIPVAEEPLIVKYQIERSDTSRKEDCGPCEPCDEDALQRLRRHGA